MKRAAVLALVLALAAGCALPGIYDSPALQGGIPAAWDARSMIASAGRWDSLPAVAEIAGGRMLEAPPRMFVDMVAYALRGCPSRPLDVAIVVDDTSSMVRFTSELAAAETVFRDAAAAGCRLALFAFRDVGDEYEARTLSTFEDGADRFAAAYEKLGFAGGGDWAEGTWRALDVATDALFKADRPGLLILISDAPAHSDPVTAERVHERLEAGRIDTLVLELPHPVHGRAKTPPPKREPPITLAALAARLGAKDVRADRSHLAEAVVDELREASAAAHGPVDVTLVVDSSARMGRSIPRLVDVADAVRAIESDGGRVALVAYRDEGDAWAARVVAPLEARGLAARILDRAGTRLPADEGEPANEAVVALGVAATLAWEPRRARAVILLSNTTVRPNLDAEEVFRRFRAEPGTRVTVIEIESLKSAGGTPAPPDGPASAPGDAVPSP